jgi:hypothetical protein
MELHERYMKFVNVAFERDGVFIEALDKACRAVVNIKFKGGFSSKVSRVCDVARCPDPTALLLSYACFLGPPR